MSLGLSSWNNSIPTNGFSLNFTFWTLINICPHTFWFSLFLDKTYRHFTWRPVYIYVSGFYNEDGVLCEVRPIVYETTHDINIPPFTIQVQETRYLQEVSTRYPTVYSRCVRNTISRKGKAVPLEAWSGPEGSRKLRFPDLMTTAQDGGKVVSLAHRPPLPTGNTPGTHFC